MDNSVNALQMAAGLIFGVLLLAALVYVFNILPLVYCYQFIIVSVNST